MHLSRPSTSMAASSLFTSATASATATSGAPLGLYSAVETLPDLGGVDFDGFSLRQRPTAFWTVGTLKTCTHPVGTSTVD